MEYERERARTQPEIFIDNPWRLSCAVHKCEKTTNSRERSTRKQQVRQSWKPTDGQKYFVILSHRMEKSITGDIGMCV